MFDESDTTAPAPAPANDEDANPTKVLATTIATEFLCPVTHELPIAPVMAKDGVVYERAAIERWFEEGLELLANVSCLELVGPRTSDSGS